MIEKLMNLLERAVVALEKLALDATNPLQTVAPAAACCADPCAGQTVVEGSTAPVAEDPAVNEYGSWDRDAVLAECEKRGIEVPPRVRTATLVGQLEEFDKGWRPNTQTEPEPTPEEPKVEDPFAETAPEPEPAKYPTIEETRAVLRRLMVANDNNSAPVTELIKKHAGVEKIAMVTPDKFQPIIDEAETLIAGLQD